MVSSPSMLLTLTEDLLARVYQLLGSDWDRKSWRLVCREFLRIDSLSRRAIRILRVEFLQSLLLKHPNLSFLDLSVCPRIDDGVIFGILRNGVASPRWPLGLKSLNLSRVTGLHARGFEALVRACTSLERVDVSHCWGFGDAEAAALSAVSGLRALKMVKCLNLSDVGLAKIAVGCGKLEQISLKWSMKISDLGVDLLCKKCRELRSLDVSYLKVTNKSLLSIASLPKLEVLGMESCRFIDDSGLEVLETGCPVLQAIDLTRSPRVSLVGLTSIVRGHPGLVRLSAGHCVSELSAGFLPLMKDLKNIETVMIEGARVSDSVFEELSANCLSLVEINLSKCHGVSNIGIIMLAHGCSNLKALNLTCCKSITDVAIAAIAKSCRNLSCLKLESCNMITEKSLHQLGLLCTSLEELDLTECHGVTDRGLDHISRCSNLLRLKLGLCINISGRGLFYISLNCAQLLELDLYRCSGIGDEGLAALSGGCKKLSKLILSYCHELTDKGMESVGRLKELSSLELRGMKSITGKGLMAIASGCKKLARLDLKLCEKIDDSGFWALSYFSRNLRQINLCYCAISDMALCIMMGSLTRLQDVDLLNLTNVSPEGIELALRAGCVCLKKVKLSSPFRFCLSSELLETLHSRGCRIKWD